MRLPTYMTTCYFCMAKFHEVERLTEHLEVCSAKKNYLTKPDHDFYHVGIRPTRNMLGEVVFGTEWKRLLETPLEEFYYDEEDTRLSTIVNFIREPLTQTHASIAASFIIWLGTNCGNCFLDQAKKLIAANPHRGRSQMFLAQWAIENRRSTGINHSGRMIEHLMDTAESTMFGRSAPFPVPTMAECEVIEHVAFWLGSDEGQMFLTQCERLISIRQKGLSNSDLRDIGLHDTAKKGADPKCKECEGTGMRDSGGVMPWGEYVQLPCECRED